MVVTFSVIVPTAGRDTLARTLASVAPQLQPGDELLVIRDDCEWGNTSRDQAMRQAKGTHLLFLDDDDAYLPDALQTIRAGIGAAPARIHIFRMNDHGLILWERPELEPGQVGTPMVCVPRRPTGSLGRWANPAGQLSDFQFLADTITLRGNKPPVFHDEVVALVRP